MSLVNDVLRQLETNPSQPYKRMRLQPLVATGIAEKNNRIHIFFLAVIAVLLIIISLQVFSRNSVILDVNGHDVIAPIQLKNMTPELTNIIVPEFTSVVDPEKAKIMARVSKMPIVKSEMSEILPITASIVSPEQKAENTEVLVSDYLQQVPEKFQAIKQEAVNQEAVNQEAVNQEAVNQEAEQYEPLNKITTKSIDSSLTEEANITTVKSAGFKHYQLALRAYQEKDSKVALTWINLALSEESKEKYLRLKVRILMQQGLGNEIYKLAIEQANNTSLSWFELIAPSLQMYSFHELSNKYYSELIKQQPNETKWQLAMALNYSKLGRNDRTSAIYKNLLASTLLTYRQKKWITSRLEKMNPSEVAIYE